MRKATESRRSRPGYCPHNLRKEITDHTMNEIQVFKNPEFGEVRIVSINNEPWFVGKDVAQVLGYTDINHTILDHVDTEDRVNSKTQGQNAPELGQRGGWLINESGLYSLILSSKLPTAKAFKRWVTSEVLPAIRRNGGYIAGQENMTDQEIMARALFVAQKTIESKNRQIAEMQPKALFADSVAASSSTILVGELAKILRQNGVDIGEKRLFAWMRDNGYLIRRKGSDYNMPTQKSVEMELLWTKETVISHSNGHTTVSKTPKVTGKGQQYFINKFLSTVPTE